MNFEDRAKELHRDLVLQAVIDKANGVVNGSCNLRALIAAALEEAYMEGREA